MNASLSTADRLTHLKIVAIALTAAIVVVWLGILSRPGSVAMSQPPQLLRGLPAVGAMMADTAPGSIVR